MVVWLKVAKSLLRHLQKCIPLWPAVLLYIGKCWVLMRGKRDSILVVCIHIHDPRDHPYIMSAIGQGWVGSESGNFCSRSVLYLCWPSGWVRKSLKICRRIIGMVPNIHFWTVNCPAHKRPKGEKRFSTRALSVFALGVKKSCVSNVLISSALSKLLKLSQATKR